VDSNFHLQKPKDTAMAEPNNPADPVEALRRQRAALQGAQGNPPTAQAATPREGNPTPLARQIAEHLRKAPSGVNGNVIELSGPGGSVVSANNRIDNLPADLAARRVQGLIDTFMQDPAYKADPKVSPEPQFLLRNTARTTLVLSKEDGGSFTRTQLTELSERAVKAEQTAAAKAAEDARRARLEQDMIAAGKSMRYPPGPPPAAPAQASYSNEHRRTPPTPSAAAPAAPASAAAPSGPDAATRARMETEGRAMRYPPGPPPAAPAPASYSNEHRRTTQPAEAPAVSTAAPAAASPAPAAAKPPAGKPAAQSEGPRFDPQIAATERFLIALGEKNNRNGVTTGNFHFLVDKVDGYRDENFTTALKSFQEHYGLKQTGRLDKPTVTRIQEMVLEAGGQVGAAGTNGVMSRETMRGMASFDNLSGNFSTVATPAPRSADPMGDFIRDLPALRDGAGTATAPAAPEAAVGTGGVDLVGGLNSLRDGATRLGGDLQRKAGELADQAAPHLERARRGLADGLDSAAQRLRGGQAHKPE
jgi:hypothetical protein